MHINRSLLWQKNTKTLTVSFRTVTKLMRKFFLDSKSVNNLFKSDFVTRLSTPASSITYVSLGGPSLITSNSEANALPLGKSGLKLSARVIARAASPCWACESQLVGVGKDELSDWGWCFLRLQVMDLVTKREFDDLGWIEEEEERVFGQEGLGLKRGERERGERMVSMEESNQGGSQMVKHEGDGE